MTELAKNTIFDTSHKHDLGSTPRLSGRTTKLQRLTPSLTAQPPISYCLQFILLKPLRLITHHLKRHLLRRPT
jgi:hypothetical protein